MRRLARPIARIAEDRMLRFRKMNADLIAPPRFQVNLQEGNASPHFLHGVMGDGQPPADSECTERRLRDLSLLK